MADSTTLGSAYIDILPSLKNFNLNGVFRNLEREADRSGDRIGEGLGESIDDGVDQGLDKAERQVKKRSGRIGDTMKGVFAGGALLGAAEGVISGLSGVFSEAINASDGIDKFKQSMSFAGISDKEIVRMTKSTKAYADATVFSLSDIQNATAQFAANGVKGADGLVESLGNLNAVAGGNSETFKSINMAMSQTLGAGKLTTENWNQIADAIPGASGLIQKALKENGAFTGDFRGAMEDGQITAEEFTAAINELGQTDGARKAATSTSTFEGAAGNLQATIVGGLTKAIEGIKPVAIDVFNNLSTGLSKTINFIENDAIPAFKSIVGWMKENKAIVTALGIGLGVAAVAFGVISVATGIWAGAMGLLNAVLLASPITWVVLGLAAIVGAIVFAYMKFESFRKVVDSVWAAIRIGIAFAWNKVIKPVFQGIWGFIQNTLIPIFKRLWAGVIRPVFGAIAKHIGVQIKIVRGVFTALHYIFKYIIFPIIRSLWVNVIRPVFSAIAKHVSAVWRNTLRPVFNALGTFIRDKVAPVFRKAVDAIGRIWDGLKEKARKPVAFLVNTVYNEGIRKMIGAIPGVKTPPSLKFASGGVLPGYSPGRDIHQFTSPTGGRLALSGGEAIMRPEFTKAVGGAKGVGLLNAMARKGQAFAKGGVFNPLPGSRRGTYPGHDGVDLNVGSGWADYGLPYYANRAGTISYVGSGRGYGLAVFQSTPVGTLVYGHSSATRVKAGQSVRAGQQLGNVGNTGNSSAPHLHFGFPGGTYAQALALLSGAGMPSGGTRGTQQEAAPKWLTAVKDIPAMVSGVWSNIKSLSSYGPFGGYARSAGKSALTGAAGYIDGKIPNTLLPDNPVQSVMKRLGIFDNGGILEPGALAYNASRKPEAVFNQKQFKSFAEGRNNERPKTMAMVITNWDEGTGYIEAIVDESIALNEEYSA